MPNVNNLFTKFLYIPTTVGYRIKLKVSQNGFEPFTNPCRVELLAMCVALTVDETMA